MTAATDANTTMSAEGSEPRRRRSWPRVVLGVVVLVLMFPMWVFTAASCAPDTASLSDWSAAPIGGADLIGPENLDFDDNGCVYTGLLDGRVVRIDPDGATHTIANTGGRPLGVRLHPTLHLVVADRDRGLLAVSADGDVRVLVDTIGEQSCQYVNGLAVAFDGRIYFTQPSTRYPAPQIAVAALTGDRTGRLLTHDPATGETRVVADGLCFANGVALVDGGDAALVSETFARRVTRVQLTGPDAGAHRVWADDLPGYPDNIVVDEQQHVWLAIHTDRNAALETISAMPGLPYVIAPFVPDAAGDERQPRTPGRIVVLDAAGRVLHHLRDASASYGPISTAAPHNGHVYLGSSSDAGVGRMNLPAAAK
ncbi:MAG: hypothetical protein GC159_21950 [Phycisphaera sp.]|nr:hypothetical protein [Phycisphaera sp.]